LDQDQTINHDFKCIFYNLKTGLKICIVRIKFNNWECVEYTNASNSDRIKSYIKQDREKIRSNIDHIRSYIKEDREKIRYWISVYN